MEKKEPVQREIEDDPSVVVLSADMICAMVSFGDKEFRKFDQQQKAKR